MDRQSYTATGRDDEGSRGVHPPQDKGKVIRNKRPCGRCSKSQRKVMSFPRFSSTRLTADVPPVFTVRRRTPVLVVALQTVRKGRTGRMPTLRASQEGFHG